MLFKDLLSTDELKIWDSKDLIGVHKTNDKKKVLLKRTVEQTFGDDSSSGLKIGEKIGKCPQNSGARTKRRWKDIIITFDLYRVFITTTGILLKYVFPRNIQIVSHWSTKTVLKIRIKSNSIGRRQRLDKFYHREIKYSAYSQQL